MLKPWVIQFYTPANNDQIVGLLHLGQAAGPIIPPEEKTFLFLMKRGHVEYFYASVVFPNSGGECTNIAWLNRISKYVFHA